MPPAPAPFGGSDNAADDDFRCSECGSFYENERKLSAHMRKRHGDGRDSLADLAAADGPSYSSQDLRN